MSSGSKGFTNNVHIDKYNSSNHSTGSLYTRGIQHKYSVKKEGQALKVFKPESGAFGGDEFAQMACQEAR